MFLIFTVSLGVISADPLPPPGAKELKQLQGQWVFLLGERNGTREKASKDDPKEVLEIRGDKWIFTGQQKGRIIALDSKSIDIKSTEQGDVGQVDRGIYRLTRDTLTFCLYHGNGRKRPTEFTSKDEDTILAVFKRLKP